jgi:hypothetical protein
MTMHLHSHLLVAGLAPLPSQAPDLATELPARSGTSSYSCPVRRQHQCLPRRTGARAACHDVLAGRSGAAVAREARPAGGRTSLWEVVARLDAVAQWHRTTSPPLKPTATVSLKPVAAHPFLLP